MSGERWEIGDEDSTYPDLVWRRPGFLATFTVADLAETWPETEDDLVDEAHAALVADVRAAARLRSLAAIYEQPLNRDTTFTFKGSELAAMLKEEG